MKHSDMRIFKNYFYQKLANNNTAQVNGELTSVVDFWKSIQTWRV